MDKDAVCKREKFKLIEEINLKIAYSSLSSMIIDFITKTMNICS